MTAPVTATGPAEAVPATVREALRQRIAAAGHPGVDVLLRPLGMRDELAPHPPDAAAGRGTVPVQLYGHMAVLGPLPDAGRQTAARPCGQCLARRWQALRHEPVRDALELGGPTRAVGTSPYLTPFVLDTMAALIGAARAGEIRTDDGPPLVRRLNMERLLVRSFPLVADPECPACGTREAPDGGGAADSAIPAPPPLTLPSAPKPATDVFRLRKPGDYDLPVTAFANPLCGTVGTGVIRELDSLATASTFGSFALRSGHYLYEVAWGGHTTRYRDSVTVGVLEGLERYAGMRPRRRPAVVASLRSLRERGLTALDPRDCGLYAPEFYAAQDRVLPFSESRALPWVWGHSLGDGHPVLMPEVLTYYHSAPLEDRFVQECSNGCASGSTLTEAVHSALMELIERDAFLLTWYGRAALPEIDARTSRRPTTRHLVDRLALYGYRARFFDARITFPVPVVIAAAVREDGGTGALCFGAGASPDPESALAAALAEIATDAPRLRRRTEHRMAELRTMAEDFDAVQSLSDHPLLYGLPQMTRHASFLLGDPDGGSTPRGPYSLSDLYSGTRPAPQPGTDLAQDVHACVRGLAGHGFETLVVDQTLPEQRAVGVHTVGVTVPGLLPIDFGQDRQRARLMPRTRTALHAAGLLDHDLDTSEVNPAPHPFP
ncbi:TOMM precursor leader peptide-binding protein [Streptomyces sp. NPDC020379]|uniref:TOMM precursor leader peptide-binding protein n=1 Tax=Streptomyces sp. NPDC020379 TaxID=3365071 RepID=UPI003793133E